jgi:hypothetical protein
MRKSCLHKLTILILIIGMSVLSASTFIHADESDITENQVTSLQKLKVLKLVIKISKSQGYNIENQIREQFKRVGIKVVPESNREYDATVFVDYQETEGLKYTPLGTGTDIRCNINIVNKEGGSIFKEEATGATSLYVLKETLYGSAIKQFEKNLDSVFLKLKVLVTGEYSPALKSSAPWQMKIVGKYALEPLLRALTDRDWEVRMNAADHLGDIGDVRAVEPLMLRLKDEDDKVRTSAAKSLGKIGDARALISLIDMLKDKNWIVRTSAVTALGLIGDVRAVEPLNNLYKSENETLVGEVVRKEIKHALEQIKINKKKKDSM